MGGRGDRANALGRIAGKTGGILQKKSLISISLREIFVGFFSFPADHEPPDSLVELVAKLNAGVWDDVVKH